MILTKETIIDKRIQRKMTTTQTTSMIEIIFLSKRQAYLKNHLPSKVSTSQLTKLKMSNTFTTMRINTIMKTNKRNKITKYLLLLILLKQLLLNLTVLK